MAEVPEVQLVLELVDWDGHPVRHVQWEELVDFEHYQELDVPQVPEAEED